MTSESAELRRTVRAFLAAESAESDVRALFDSDDGFDRDVWQRLTRGLGLTGIGIPDQYGGDGFGVALLHVVFEEMGRALYTGPYFATIALASNLLLALDDDEACRELLPQIADGTLTATVGLLEAGRRRWDPAAVQARALHDGSTWRVDGTKQHVVDAAAADLVLVDAMTDRGPAVLAVRRDDPGVTIEPSPTMDLTRRQAVVRLERAPARLVGEPGGAGAAISSMLDRAAVALAAEQAGAARRVVELTVSHVATREQFGRPVGSFQAVKHLCADMLLDAESASAIAFAAAEAADDPAFRVKVHAAQSWCSESFWRVAAQAVQAHGGIGFTWEHPVQLYFKRAKSSELLFGTPAEHRDELLSLLGV